MQSDTSQQSQPVSPQEEVSAGSSMQGDQQRSMVCSPMVSIQLMPLIGSHDASSEITAAGNALVVQDDQVKPSLHQEGAQSSASSATDESSSSSAFLLGMHNFSNLPSDLPEFVREHQATLTFPEKLMLMLTYVERDYSTPGIGNDVDRAAVGWILDGRAFIIRSKDDLVKGLLPMFFRQGKFASFTRKLYRWGFRQVSVSPDCVSGKREMIFGHEWFQRDNKQLMASMRSITAAGTRRALVSSKQKRNSTSGQNVVLEPKKLVPTPVHTSFIQLQPMASTPGRGGPMTSFAFKASTGSEPEASQQMTTHSILGAMITRPPTTMTAAPFLHDHHALLVARTQQQVQGIIVDTEQAGKHTVAGGNGYLTSLAQLGAQGRTFQDLQGQALNGTDPNAYMRAAIDMLLRHASKNSTSYKNTNAA